MLLRHQLVYDYELYLISILFPAFQYLASPLSILPYLSEKAQLQPDFFDRLKRETVCQSPAISLCTFSGHAEELIWRQNLDSKLLCLCQLASGVLAAD